MTLPAPRSSREAALRRLHGLVRTVNGDLDLRRTLDNVCQGVVEGLGFGVAVVNLATPEGDLEVVSCAGDEQVGRTLLGTRASRQAWDDVLALCEPVGELLVDYHHRLPLEGDMATWVPDLAVSSDPDAWHPLDELFAPLRTPRSGLLGVLSVDLPRDGRRPGPDALELLEMFAGQASVAIENAQLHEALRREHDSRAETLGRLSELVGSVPVGIVELDLDGRVRVWNAAAERIFGWTAGEVLGGLNPVVEVSREQYDATLRGLHEGPLRRVSVRRRRKDGTSVDLEMSSAVLHDEHGRPFGYLGVYADVTERLALEEQLRTAAFSDALTGLANRALFTERLEQAVDGGGGATVLLLDLDGFKAVNDAEGHAAGDRVLREVARRLLAVCRAEDLVARLGGDEFVVLLGGAEGRAGTQSDGAAEALAERLVATLAEPFPAAPGHGLGASVGLARLAGAGSADVLLRQADLAMYSVKARGKGGWSVYVPGLGRRLGRSRRS